MKDSHDRFDAENTRRVSLKFNRHTDAQVIEWIEKQDSIQGAIRKLILAEIEKEQG